MCNMPGSDAMSCGVMQGAMGHIMTSRDVMMCDVWYVLFGEKLRWNVCSNAMDSDSIQIVSGMINVTARSVSIYT